VELKAASQRTRTKAKAKAKMKLSNAHARSGIKHNKHNTHTLVVLGYALRKEKKNLIKYTIPHPHWS
jgi:hypothetical protein